MRGLRVWLLASRAVPANNSSNGGAQTTPKTTAILNQFATELRYAGTTGSWLLKYRPEPQFEKHDGDVFPREARAVVVRCSGRGYEAGNEAWVAS